MNCHLTWYYMYRWNVFKHDQQGLTVKNITDKMDSIILTVYLFFSESQKHRFLRFFLLGKWIIFYWNCIKKGLRSLLTLTFSYSHLSQMYCLIISVKTKTITVTSVSPKTNVLMNFLEDLFISQVNTFSLIKSTWESNMKWQLDSNKAGPEASWVSFSRLG